jgi:predicted transcriptional regulator
MISGWNCNINKQEIQEHKMDWLLVRPDTKKEALEKLSVTSEQHTFAIVDTDNTYRGLISIDDINSSDSAVTAIDVFNECSKRENKFIYVDENEPLDQAKSKLRLNKLQFMPVIDETSKRFIGTIDRYSN